MSGQVAGLRSRLATPRSAVLLGVLVLVLAVLVVPLAILAGATGDSSGGGSTSARRSGWSASWSPGAGEATRWAGCCSARSAS